MARLSRQNETWLHDAVVGRLTARLKRYSTPGEEGHRTPQGGLRVTPRMRTTVYATHKAEAAVVTKSVARKFCWHVLRTIYLGRTKRKRRSAQIESHAQQSKSLTYSVEQQESRGTNPQLRWCHGAIGRSAAAFPCFETRRGRRRGSGGATKCSTSTSSGFHRNRIIALALAGAWGGSGGDVSRRLRLFVVC
ncbi:hypothetical protein BDY21DRAFT_93972 [Lineolata rhizophorae]|uniref:Uncharacterized protein n=1 Tax=Lineolata rhizophorae TaxID=578093 RepID=A0A6A6PEB6_9PEZI|nr:hypothetical protein BDY21DRAFT_93972 [Lineolata rhizophorae]